MLDPPRDGLPEGPATSTIAIQAELAGEPVEAIENITTRMPELRATDESGDSELALPGERLGVDRKPRLALRAEHVPGVEVLVQEDLLSLCGREHPERVERRIEELALERPAGSLPFAGEVAHPPGGFFRERAKGRAGRLPQPRQEPDHHVERRISVERRERRPRPAALEEQRMPLRVVVEETNGAVAAPVPEGVRLVLALAMRELDFEDDVARGRCERRVGVGKRGLELEPPFLATVCYKVGKALEPRAALRKLLEPG